MARTIFKLPDVYLSSGGMGKEKFILVLILILGLGLRLIKLDQSFWLDEASQAQISSLSLSQIWSGRQADFHPPLFYILSHYWVQFGRSEVWLRLLPITFGAANIYVIYYLASYLTPFPSPNLGEGSRKGVVPGLIAALLLAINPYHIYYSQEFRMYSLLALLGTMSMYLLLKKKYFWVALVNTVMLYTHYASILLIIAQAIISPITIYYSLLTLILYMPWLPQFLRQLHSGVNVDQYLPGWRGVLTIGPLKAVPLVLFKLLAGRIDFVSRIGYAIYIGFVLTVLGVSLVLSKTKRWFLLTWIFVPLLLSIIISFVIPLTQPFRLIFILPGLILVLTQAVLRFPKLLFPLIIYISVTGIVMYATRPRLQREQWRQAINFLQQQNKTVMVKFFDKFAPFYWYGPDVKVVTKIPENEQEFYFMEYLTGLTDPEGETRKKLETGNWKLEETKNFEGVGFIYRYSKL